MAISRMPVRRPGRVARLAATAAAVAALTLSTVASTSADESRRVLDARLAGLPASMVGQTLFGVVAGGLPWRLEGGRAKLWADGRLVVNVDGLVLAAGGAAGTNPIPHGQAIVTCAGAVAAMSSVVPFSVPEGDAHVSERVALPAGCLAPAVFFAGVPAPGVARWFAVTGF